MMFSVPRRALVWLILTVACAACSLPATAMLTSTPTPLRVGALTPYHTPTSTASPVVLATRPLPTSTPAPTSTPFTYTVKKGDTMLAIAFQYGVTLEQLLAANPTVQPRLLPVGTVLIIPLGGETPTPEPTLSLPPLQVEPPRCFLQADGGVWCFLLVQNDLERAVENLSGRVGLFSPEGESLGSQTAYPLLDILPAGGRLPLVAFFPPPVAGQFTLQGELLTALEVPEGDGRYLEASFHIERVSISPDGLTARVSGVITLEESPVGQVWLAGVAYDKQGNVIGARRWQALPPCSAAAGEVGASTPESNCPRFPFEGTLYSLGPAIVSVEVLAEAKP